MNYITKIKLANFKRFNTFEVDLDKNLNLLIGDNEAGKSSILLAIDLTISGNRNKVESIGLEHLFNSSSIFNFLNSNRNLNNLPTLKVELYFNDTLNDFTDGKNNSYKKECNGVKLTCEPNKEYNNEIANILKDPNCIFPFEFYTIDFQTFAGQSFNSYTKCLKHILIDNSQISNEYAMREYVKEIYNSNLNELKEKYTHQHEYRLYKNDFKNNSLSIINSRLLKVGDYSFGIKSNSKSNLETDLTIYDGDITIDNKGKGKQCIIKTELSLTKNENDLEVILLEEPENHLSHLNTQKLVNKINESNDKQIFIATHSNLISSRLDLRNCILINSNSNIPIKLSDLPETTAKYFIKAPDNNILQFILSKKVVLVEGDAEYILSETLFKKATNNELKNSEISIISVDGTSFKRYLDIAIKLDIKTAVITDNDGNYKENVEERYLSYSKQNIKIFSDPNNERKTFEVCIYQDNKAICDELFEKGRKKLTVQEFMLKNKAEVAYVLLENKATEITPSNYLIEAFKWIEKN